MLSEQPMRPPTIEDFFNATIDMSPPVQAIPVVTQSEVARLQAVKNASSFRDAYESALGSYEMLRLQMNSVLRAIWEANSQFEKGAGQWLPEFEFEKFRAIHIPRLLAGNTLPFDSGITTTQASIFRNQESHGQAW